MFSQENTPIKVGLLDLLFKSNGSQYVIPAYQRNYTWTANKDVKQLLEDLRSVLAKEYDRHFMGIMIYLEKSINAFSRECSVIDGQQRLTTLFLILYAIKEILLERGMTNEASQLETCYLINPNNNGIKFKLKPLVADDTVYQQIIARDFENITNKDSNVYKNFFYIKEELSKLGERYSLLDEILPSINLLYIVCVPITNADYPQKIFESINATGEKLTASDLIRNFILMPIDSNKQDDYYVKYWKKIEELVSPEAKKLEAFFRFFLMAKKRTIINKNSVYREFTIWYKEVEPALQVEGIFKEIVSYASYYNRIYIADTAGLEAEIRKPIEEFRYILSDMPAPLLIELYSLHTQKTYNGQSKISSAQFAEIVGILNSYLMRRALAGMDTSDISRYFPTLLKETLSDCSEDFTNIVEIFKKNLVNKNKGNSQEMPDSKKLFDRIYHANMYNLRAWLVIFYRKLESKNNPAPVDFSKLSVEHLMPQTATPDWYAELKTDKETYEENLHRLGNLTLAARPDNSKMGNKPWEFKNKVLSSTAHLKMNAEILAKEKWTIQDIEDRTKSLIQAIEELYPYYDSKDSDIEKVPIFINLNGGYAIGTFYPANGSVEVASGSILSKAQDFAEDYPDVEAIRQELLDDGIIKYNGEQLEFAEDYTFYPKRTGATALSAAANVILHGSRNGWEYWCTESGAPVNVLKKDDNTLFD